MEQPGSSSGSYPEGRRFKSFSCYQSTKPPQQGRFLFFRIMPELPYPQIDQSTGGSLLVLFALQRGNQVESLVLQKDGPRLGPLVSSDDTQVNMKRRARLVMEAALANLVVLDENWIFLGWHQDKELWLGISGPDMWMSGPPQHIVSISPSQLLEVIEGGTTQAYDPNIVNSPLPGQSLQAPSWLGDLICRMGWAEEA